mmetsp:Transcript_6315/g.17128  ORF Transcript_6315/g.17128 Transcript_6315/m.17128 type:complete len:278 (+) Transcript_6315:1642-2475(+)
MPHAPQSPTSQFLCRHASELQPRTSTRSAGQGLPPFAGNCSTCRWRLVCPPPQVRSQSAHGVQSATSQSTGLRAQVAVSRSVAAQDLPPPAGCVVTERLRVVWPRTHGIHSCQSLSLQSTASSHTFSWQCCTSVRGPAKRVALPEAGRSSFRVRAWWPSPQDRLQPPHSSHALRRYGSLFTAAWLQALVSRSAPSHCLPPPVGACKTSRARSYWPFSLAEQSVQWDQLESRQSWLTSHVMSHFFVSKSVPLQGLPHSLFNSATTRCLSQRPVQLSGL